jgi:hypothetical protein
MPKAQEQKAVYRTTSADARTRPVPLLVGYDQANITVPTLIHFGCYVELTQVLASPTFRVVLPNAWRPASIIKYNTHPTLKLYERTTHVIWFLQSCSRCVGTWTKHQMLPKLEILVHNEPTVVTDLLPDIRTKRVSLLVLLNGMVCLHSFIKKGSSKLKIEQQKLRKHKGRIKDKLLNTTYLLLYFF